MWAAEGKGRDRAGAISLAAARAAQNSERRRRACALTPAPLRLLGSCRVPSGYPSAGALSDLSVHMCFICVLHLANEHGLAIEGQQSLDELKIRNVPVEA